MFVMKSDLRSDCPIAASLDVIGDRWTLVVLRDLLLTQKVAFSEIGVQEGIATNILMNRLERLTEAGIIECYAHPTDGRRRIYLPTQRGIELIPVLVDLVVWGTDHTSAQGVRKIAKAIKQDREGVIKSIEAESAGKLRRQLAQGMNGGTLVLQREPEKQFTAGTAEPLCCPAKVLDQSVGDVNLRQQDERYVILDHDPHSAKIRLEHASVQANWDRNRKVDSTDDHKQCDQRCCHLRLGSNRDRSSQRRQGRCEIPERHYLNRRSWKFWIDLPRHQHRQADEAKRMNK